MITADALTKQLRMLLPLLMGVWRITRREVAP
jgi:hypothetical protein